MKVLLSEFKCLSLSGHITLVFLVQGIERTDLYAVVLRNAVHRFSDLHLMIKMRHIGPFLLFLQVNDIPPSQGEVLGGFVESRQFACREAEILSDPIEGVVVACDGIE